MPRLSRRVTAGLSVRVSPETNDLRAQLQETTGLDAGRLIERALEAYKAELERRRTIELDAA
jgi:hypothetical protein